MNEFLIMNVPRVVVALIFGIFLFGSSALSWNHGFPGPAVLGFKAVLQDSQTQFLIEVCMFFYFFLFSWLQNRAERRRFWYCDSSVAWLTNVLFIILSVYVFDVPTASKSTQALTVLSAGTLGAASAWLAVGVKKDGMAVAEVLSLLMIWLVVASFWNSSSGRTYVYRGQVRWNGPWDNPNIFGLLMGAAAALAAGLGLRGWRMGYRCGKTEDRRSRMAYGRFGVGALCMVVALLMGRGLLHSYSRGAWVATGCGGVYLLWQWIERGQRASETCGVSRCSYNSRLTNRWLPLSVVLFSVVVLLFWHFRLTDWVPARRALSSVNAADFSWRNRVEAWEGDLQITAERPWFGAGWNQPEPLYGHYYLPTKLTESAGIQMNDYLMLGATLGIPALFCFAMYLWLSLTRKAESRKQKVEILDAWWHQTTCRAGAIVLLVGFWFDGGLFKLPTAATFWILLELGAERPQSPEVSGQQSKVISPDARS